MPTSLSAAWEHDDGYRAQLDGTLIDETFKNPVSINAAGIITTLPLGYESAESLTAATTLQLGLARPLGKLHFLEVRDGTGIVQAVIFHKDVSKELFEAGAHLSQETSLEVTGSVKRHPKLPQ